MPSSPTKSVGSNEEEPEMEPEEQFDIEIIQNTLSPELLKEVLDLTKKTLKTSRVEKDTAVAIKKAFDEKIFGSTWHCIVGTHFAVSVQFDTEYFTFFKIDQHHVLLVCAYSPYSVYSAISPMTHTHYDCDDIIYIQFKSES